MIAKIICGGRQHPLWPGSKIVLDRGMLFVDGNDLYDLGFTVDEVAAGVEIKIEAPATGRDQWQSASS
jgi:hypothetical protein